MATRKTVGPTAGTSAGNTGDGQVGANPDQPSAKPEGPGKAMAWDELDSHLLEAEVAGGIDFRIVRVWHPSPEKTMWNGLYGSAPTEVGAPAYRTKDGKITAL